MDTNFNFGQLQSQIDKWIREHGGYWPPLSMLGAVVEELGEIARAINFIEGYKPKKEGENPILGEELADAIFALICIANYYKINLSKELLNSISKYSKRDSQRFK